MWGTLDRALSSWGESVERTLTGLFTDRRSSQMAQGMLAGMFPGGWGHPPVRGSRELLRAYGTMPWLRAVVHKIADGMSSVEWQVMAVKNPQEQRVRRVKSIQRCHDYRRRAGLLTRYKQAGELVEIDDHPMLDALDASNPILTGLTNRKLTQLYMELVGEFFWIKERGTAVNGRTRQRVVTGLWPIPPTWVLNTPTLDRPAFRVGYRAWQKEIPSTEMIWAVDPNPLDPYARGLGTAQALADELESDEYAAKHVRAFFLNRARPDLIISSNPQDGGASPDEMAVLKEKWLNEHLGFPRAWKPMFVNRKLDIHELEQNFRNLQLVQLREHERNVIMQTWGLPPEILGVLTSSNRATIDAADLFMARYILLPRLEFMRAILQERLAPEYDERIIVHYVSPVQEDREYHLKGAMAMPETVTVDEWRTKFQGLEPMEDKKTGQMHLVRALVTPKEKLEEPEEPVMLPGLPGLPGAGAPKPEDAAPPRPEKAYTNGHGPH